jgi:hypothetical protein
MNAIDQGPRIRRRRLALGLPRAASWIRASGTAVTEHGDGREGDDKGC